MDINIIGPGVVGKATGEAWGRFGHNIDYTDIDEEFYSGADLFVICTPEEAVGDVLLAMRRVRHDQGSLLETEGAIVVRSSTPPGTLKGLAENWGISLWHNPEFLREATAEQDVLHAQYAIIGHASSDGIEMVPCESLDIIYAEMGIGPIYCTSTESEFLKIATNCYLATQISFWNELKRVADKLGINSHKVAKLATLDPRVSPYGAFMHGAAYGGSCLPKDVKQMIDLAQTLGLGRIDLLAMADVINGEIRDGVFFE